MAGGLLLLALAWSALRQWHTAPASSQPAPNPAPRTLLQATTVNLLNPNPYLSWAFVLGPAAITAWRQSPHLAVALVAAFYGVMVAGLALFIFVAGTARFLRPGAQRTLVLISAVTLAALGAYQLVAGVRELSAG